MKIQSNVAPCRRSGGVPVLLVEKTRCYLIVGKRILCDVEVELLGEEIIALLSSFYLMDVDYPQAQEMGLRRLAVCDIQGH
jgi:hypothetical protein